MRGLGRIYKRGNVYWIAYCHRGHEYRESTHETTEAGAGRKLREKWKDLGRGKAAGSCEERVTVAELLLDLETDYAVKKRASLPALKSHLPHLLEAFRYDRAVDITTARLNAAVMGWQGTVSDATINRWMSSLRRAFKLAVSASPKKLSSVPNFPRLKEHNARQGFFERGEFLALLAQVPDDGLRDFVEWAYWTGMRKGEAAKLTWAALDRETWTLRLHARDTKNGRPRQIVLVGPLRQIIERRAAVQRADCALIFHRQGRPLLEFRKTWRTACAAAGLRGRLFHDFRRTGVRNLIQAGVPRSVAMAISGHKTESVFERYNITSDDDVRNALERVTAYVERLPARRTVVPIRAAETVRVLSENQSQSVPIDPKERAGNSRV